MPAGLIADKLNRNGAVAAAGLCLTGLAFLFRSTPLLCVTVLGIGNCLYHVGGGVDVLNFSDKKQWMLGVFVSPGAVGLFVGAQLANSATVPWLAVSLSIFMMSAVILVGLHRTYSLRKPSGNAPISIKPKGRAPILAFICLFVVVILRSYVGVTLHTPWKNGLLLTFLAVFALALGKTMGGFLADRFGAARTAAVSLILSSILFVFSENAICGILAIFLFNMTMPLTLFCLAKLFPSARGFAFGSLTFALFLGCVPSFIGLPAPFPEDVRFHAFEAAVSLILLLVGLAACRERRERNE